MRQCHECGYLSSETESICPHCDAYLDSRIDSDGTGNEAYDWAKDVRPVVKALTPRKLIAVFVVIGILSAVLIVAVVKIPWGEDYQHTIEWQVPTSYEFEDCKFSITYTVDENELAVAKSSNIDRAGTSTNSSDHDYNIYAGREYVVISPTVERVAAKLWKTFSEFASGHPDANNARSFANFILAFVDNAVGYVGDNEQFLAGEYWAYPVQTLQSCAGDCEDSAILASALFNQMSRTNGPDQLIYGGCLIIMPGHAIAGVSLRETDMGEGDWLAVEEGGVHYYVAETTSPAVIGCNIPGIYWASNFVVLTGYSTAFA